MTSDVPASIPRGAPRPPRASATGDLAAAVVAVGIVATALAWCAGLGPGYVVKALLAAAVCLQALRVLMGSLARVTRFTAADRVTLARATLTMALAAFVGEAPHAGVAGLAVVLAATAAALDAVDGRVARRHGHASAFGARFDMEADALLVLVLSVLAWHWDKAGAWVLGAGLARYLFLAAAAVAPWLRRDLPPSRRRQAICVLQVVTLIVCLVPWVTPPSSAAVAALGLTALGVSFALDVRLLWRLRTARAALPGRD